MMRVSLQPAYVLHRRAYRETSFLVDLLTKDHGRLTVIAKGVRKERSASSGLLQAFTQLLVSWSGKGELMTLTGVEAHGESMRLKGDCLFAGFYLNELMVCLLEKWDAQPTLFALYQETIAILQAHPLHESTLRVFEKYLLEALGYGLLPQSGAELARLFAPEKHYRFVPNHGFVLSELGDQAQAKTTIFSGRSLHAIATHNWQEENSLQDAKRLHRLVLGPLLGTRPIYSRQLFMQPEEKGKSS